MLSVIDLHAAGEQARGQRVCRIITTAKADSWQLLSTDETKSPQPRLTPTPILMLILAPAPIQASQRE